MAVKFNRRFQIAIVLAKPAFHRIRAVNELEHLCANCIIRAGRLDVHSRKDLVRLERTSLHGLLLLGCLPVWTPDDHSRG